MNIGNQLTAAFADTLANHDQESQLLHQQICGAKHKCTLPGLPLDGATNHRCQNCGNKIHGPCGVEYDEDNGIITIAAKGLSFDYTMLKSPDIGAPTPHQICFLCVDKLQRDQQTRNNNNNNNNTNDMEVEHQPGQRLQHMRENFNVESVRKSSKAPKTFTKHQNQNELFILYLFNNDELHTHLNPTLVHSYRCPLWRGAVYPC